MQHLALTYDTASSTAAFTTASVNPSLAPLGGRLDCVSHIGERVIGEQANLGESDRGEIVKTTLVMPGVYIPGVNIDHELLISKSS